ncbi:MAG TPA: surface carbohydrate biosynthesis protein [Acidimicrobiales bacterium]|nr:surface carbohydrate biosynthesis protein [Acidimicrobiales bacterium]
MTAPARWLLLPVEVKARGLEGRLLLGAHAAAAGWKVVVGRKNHLNGTLDELPRGLYFDKSIQSQAIGQIRYIKALGNTYAAMDEEGLVHEGGATAYVKRRFSTDTLAATRAFCTWGQAQADVMRQAEPALVDRLAVTGNPRVDLWRPELHDLQRARIKQIRDEVGAFVLFPSNFANVIGADGPLLTQRFGEVTGHYADPAERARFGAYLDLRRGILDRLEVALVALARELPAGHVLVVRPHPSEDHTFWSDLAEGEPRLVVRYDGSLTPWMLASDGVVHSNCTTGVEAAVAGVPAIAYAPLDESDFPMLPNQVSHVVDSDEALVSAVHGVLAGRPVMPESARTSIEHHLAALDGPLAAERMVALFGTLPVRPDRGDGREGRRRTDPLRSLPVRARAWAERRRNADAPQLPRASATLASQKFPPTPLDEVEEFLDRLRGVDPRLAGVRAAQVAPSLFTLEADDA